MSWSRLQGEAFLIRHADDFVIGVAREDDARRIRDVLPNRERRFLTARRVPTTPMARSPTLYSSRQGSRVSKSRVRKVDVWNCWNCS